MDIVNNRKRLVSWVRQQLIGPATEDGSDFLLGVSPIDRYPVGVLYPLDPTGDSVDSDDVASTEEDNNDTGEDTSALTSTVRRRYVPPSSAGFSFYLPSPNWKIQVWFAASAYRITNRDKRDEKGQFERRRFERIELGGDNEAFLTSESTRRQVMLFPGEPRESLAGVDVDCRPHGDGVIVTVSLFNKQVVPEDVPNNHWKDVQLESSLFETQLRCLIEEGVVGDYPSVDYSLLDEESQELELQYQNKKVYAIGHGAAVQWKLHNQRVTEVYSDFMPVVEVQQVTADISSDLSSQVLGMKFLTRAADDRASVCACLTEFVNDYELWALRQSATVADLDTKKAPAGERICTRMLTAVQRMKGSIALLERDDVVAKAFSLANQAMLDQMLQSSKTKNKPIDAEQVRWRPFQLAFLLTSLQSAVDDSDDYRDTVDLIWFPTGGGKTEAYLGLIAAVIVWRRLKFPASYGGTTSLMRYTLRLLTTQQFIRASKMICALELLRRQHPELGKENISIGLWVGGDTSPNTFTNAHKIVETARIDDGEKSHAAFVIEQCPWCNSTLTVRGGLVATDKEFYFRCRKPDCSFGCDENDRLPCNVVDDALYQNPPTLLMATVDKFARFAWEERASSFFGKQQSRPPELIIQDELHLIASALGSIAGVYEAALETVLIQRGVYPKYIASTATIRMAEDQVRLMYGKEVAIFPPPGLDADDSYYARTVPVESEPGRMYVGYFAPMLNRANNFAPLSATLLGAPELVFGRGETDRDDMLDAWWTQLVYHGSLKGVSNSRNSFSIAHREVLERLINEAHERASTSNEQMTAEEQAGEKAYFNELRNRLNPNITQLTSIPSVTENAKTFANLEKTRGQTECIDAVLATNMVSVGLDVSRMALMIINGQPLTTAEYIQASSRVGRSDVPGLVFVNYYRDQTRSLSHYENFRPYHESFYRFVEPTSLTPFTYQARRRALHAALVIAMRHTIPELCPKKGAAKFSLDRADVRSVIDVLIKRCARADRSRASEIEDHLKVLAREWEDYAKKSNADKRQLCFNLRNTDAGADRLLYAHGDEIRGLWVTLHSMRNVENTGLLRIK